jgi:hypothetical protein
MATTLLYAATVEQKGLSITKMVSPPGTSAAPGSRLKRRQGMGRRSLQFGQAKGGLGLFGLTVQGGLMMVITA